MESRVGSGLVSQDRLGLTSSLQPIGRSPEVAIWGKNFGQSPLQLLFLSLCYTLPGRPVACIWYADHTISLKSNISLNYSRLLHSCYRDSEVGMMVYTLRPNSSVMYLYCHLCWVSPSVEDLAQHSKCGGRAQLRGFPKEPHITTYEEGM